MNMAQIKKVAGVSEVGVEAEAVAEEQMRAGEVEEEEDLPGNQETMYRVQHRR